MCESIGHRLPRGRCPNRRGRIRGEKKRVTGKSSIVEARAKNTTCGPRESNGRGGGGRGTNKNE